MTILFISTEFNFCCGVSQSIFSLARELKKKGHTIVLGAPGGTMIDELKDAGIIFEIVPVFPQKKNPKNFFDCVKAIKQIAKNYDVSVIHSHNRYAELLSIVANKFLRIPTVTTSHSMILGYKFLSFRSRYVIAPSHAVERMLVSNFGIEASRVKMIRNIPKQMHIPSREEVTSFKKSLNLFDNDYVIAGIGRLHWEKGFDLLLKALENCANIPIKVLLGGNGNEKKSLEEYAVANNLNVTFINEISRVELLYSVADVIVMPSRRDAAPLVAIEAALFAKPVIATRVGGLAEIIEDGERGLLVTPESPKEIAFAINTLYSNKEIGIKMGEQLKVYVNSEYNSSKIASSVEDVYSSFEQ